MNDVRVSLLRTAFQRLEPSLAGTVPLDTLRVKYTARLHPDVKSGKRSEDEVLREFLECCDIGHDGEVCARWQSSWRSVWGDVTWALSVGWGGPGHVIASCGVCYARAQVSFDDFYGFYNNISPLIPDDNYFQMRVWNTWNVGGSGTLRASGITPIKSPVRVCGCPPSVCRPSLQCASHACTATARVFIRLIGCFLDRRVSLLPPAFPPPHKRNRTWRAAR